MISDNALGVLVIMFVVLCFLGGLAAGVMRGNKILSERQAMLVQATPENRIAVKGDVVEKSPKDLPKLDIYYNPETDSTYFVVKGD